MKIHLLLGSGLLASAAMLASGAALSGGQTTSHNRLLAYNMATRQLAAVPAGGAMTVYFHDPATQHVAADLTVFTPPDPCTPPVQAWNYTVEFDQRYNVTSTATFDVLLAIMSDLSCSAAVTSITGTNQQSIVVITPTVN